MKTKLGLLALLLFVNSMGMLYAQGRTRNGNGDSTHQGTFKRPVFEKGPHKGKMLTSNGLKLEMVVPSNDKGNAVSYFVYDSLNHLADNKMYKGTVKYVFGDANEFLETKLLPATVTNQYIATLEGWQEYKKAIIVLTSGDAQYTFYFGNFSGGPSQGTGSHGHGGHGHGGGHRQGMGGMGGNQMGGSQMGGGGY